MIFYGCFDDLVTVYGNFEEETTTTLFSLRTRQLKANPLNNMLQVPAALNEMHFFIRKLSLIVVTMTPSLKHNTIFSMFS